MAALLARVSVPRRLEAAALVGYAVAFVLLLAPEAGRAALALEDALGVRFGWAFHPHDGDDPLSLFGVASERL